MKTKLKQNYSGMTKMRPNDFEKELNSNRSRVNIEKWSRSEKSRTINV